MIILELIASLFMGGAVFTARQGKILNWILCIGACLTYGYIMFEKNLMGQVAINAVFLIQAVIGLLIWRKDSKELLPRRFGRNRFFFYTLFISLMAFIMMKIMITYNLSINPKFDALTTAFSIFGITLLWYKFIEAWIYALLVDVVSVILFISSDLYITAFIYALFVINAVYALYQWDKKLQETIITESI